MKEDSKFAERTTLNLTTEILCVVLTTVIGLVMVPYYIDQLGMAAYAVVPLAVSVSSYMIIVANSFSNAINRFFVQALRKDDPKDAARTYSTSLKLMIWIAIVMLPLTAVISYYTPVIFDVPDGSYDSVRILFLCEFWSSIFLNFGTCFNNAMVVHNKTYVINTIRSSYLLIEIVGTVTMFTLLGAELEYIGYSYLIGIAVYVLASYIAMKRGFPDLKYRGKDADVSHMVEIGRLALWSAIVRIGNLMFLQASLIICNIMLGSEIQGGFSLVVSMVSMVGTACNAVTNVFYPFYHKYYSDRDYDNMVGIAVLGIKVLSLLIAMPLAYVCIFSPEIFTFWVGGEFVYLEDTVWVMFILLIFNCVAGIIETIPTILLKVRQAAEITIITGALNIVLAIVFVHYTDWGILGIAAAYTAAMFVRNGIILPVFVSRILEHRVMTFIWPMLFGFVAFLIGLGYCYGFSMVWDVKGTFLSILISFLVMFAIFFFVAFRFCLRKNEKEMLEQAMPSKLSGIFAKLFV